MCTVGPETTPLELLKNVYDCDGDGAVGAGGAQVLGVDGEVDAAQVWSAVSG